MPKKTEALSTYNQMSETAAETQPGPPIAAPDEAGLDAMDVTSEVMPPIATDRQLVVDFKAVDAEVPAGPGGSTTLLPAWLWPRKDGATALPAVRQVCARIKKAS
jgi:hypothetical protein